MTAQEIFQAAYENRYTWDENFPGYQADLEVAIDEQVYKGHVQVSNDYKVEVTGIEAEKIKEGVFNQIRDIVTHRKRSSFAQAHGKNTFTLGQTDPTGAVDILVQGDAMGSNYRVRGKEISQVSRVMGPMAFTINTEESLDTGDGYISIKYNAIFRDSKTQELKSKRDFVESYQKVGDYFVPSHQVIHTLDKDGVKSTVEFTFTNIQLN